MGVAKNHWPLCLFHLALLHSVYSKCPESFQCGNLGPLEFPFSDSNNTDCGLITIDGCDSGNPTIQFTNGEDRYTGNPTIQFTNGEDRYSIDIVDKISTNQFLVNDPMLQNHLNNISCFSFRNLPLPQSASVFFTVSPNLTLFTCYSEFYSQQRAVYFQHYQSLNCTLSTIYYRFPPLDQGNSIPPPECSMIQLPVKSVSNYSPQPFDLFDILTADYTLEWNASDDCYQCHNGGGRCLSNSMGGFHCKKGNRRKLILAISIAGGGLLFLLSLFVSFVIWQRKRRILSSLNPSSKSDIEDRSFHYGIPIFSYIELEQATNNFDPTNQLGGGGFGTVYYGKLRDGREVAIKRPYEHNNRIVEQFMNEIAILTSLRHPNLVSLYGCTSRTSGELLLVYDYIPNGTLADHLHGKLAKDGALTWPVRMTIAVETATALAYLHKSDIIHRDVKTNNILLDASFRAKVADFGISRLVPADVTHISTTPQGTPGYLDPEYHQCFQLTDRSDVYSFGVVLVELISSMPAVDRRRDEISLAKLAVNRIGRCAFDEVIDSSLGYETDGEVKRMTTSVAKLAFRCLEMDKEMRPSMDEVLVFLKDTQAGGDCNYEKMRGYNGNSGGNGKMIPTSPETDDVVFLKNNSF